MKFSHESKSEEKKALGEALSKKVRKTAKEDKKSESFKTSAMKKKC